jgi:hypothetical protein
MIESSSHGHARLPKYGSRLSRVESLDVIENGSGQDREKDHEDRVVKITDLPCVQGVITLGQQDDPPCPAVPTPCSFLSCDSCCRISSITEIRNGANLLSPRLFMHSRGR